MAWVPANGNRRCHARSSRTGEQCRLWGVRGTVPPTCRVHGASAGQVRASAQRRLEKQNAVQLAQRSVAGLDLSAYSDPIGALQYAVSASYAMAERLAVIAGNIPDAELVWRNKTGEHVRGELVASMKALADLRAASEAALKIGLDARRAGVQESTVNMLDAALNGTLAALGLSFDEQMRARQIFRGKIRIAGDGEPA